MLSGITRRGGQINRKVAEKGRELSRLDGGSTCALYLRKEPVVLSSVFFCYLEIVPWPYFGKGRRLREGGNL